MVNASEGQKWRRSWSGSSPKATFDQKILNNRESERTVYLEQSTYGVLLTDGYLVEGCRRVGPHQAKS